MIVKSIEILIRVDKEEAETLYKASLEELPCPRCDKPLIAELSCVKEVDGEFFSSLHLHCAPGGVDQGCGFIET